MFTKKIKKVSLIAWALVSAITLSTFSTFAAGPAEKSLGGQTIGTSSEIGTPHEHKISNPTNEQVIAFSNKFSKPNVISLTTPGDYRLVGAKKALSEENLGPNDIIVNINDRISIGDIKHSWDDIGDPHEKYNIILDNVNIDTNEGKSYNISPITIGKNVDATFTFARKNSLNCESEHCTSAICGDFKSSKLTINELDEDSSLDAHGGSHGIFAHNLIINGGIITATGKCGIDASNTTINGGTITSTGKVSIGIGSFNLTINAGTITATGEVDGLSSTNIEINDGTIVAACKKGSAICSSHNLIINGGTITATGEKSWGLYDFLSSGLYASCNIEINGGKVNANTICLERNVIMNGGELIIDSIHSITQGKDINFNHNMSKFFNESTELYAAYDAPTNMYGTYDDKGERVWIKDAGKNNKDADKNNNDKIIVYHLTLDRGRSKSINFYITGGTINGIIDFTPGASSNTSTNEMRFGSQFSNQFPTPGSGNAFCDTTTFFNKK
jgi:hypothetical protein